MSLLLDQLSTSARGRIPAGGSTVSSARVTAAIRTLSGADRSDLERNWAGAIAQLVLQMRPDLARQFEDYLAVKPSTEGALIGLSIGEIGVVYEALTALADHRSRRENGQYFTPDDVAAFMASNTARFPDGAWLDPCCGVGNLSWHLANAMSDPGTFVAERLTLVDLDPTALRTAIVLLVAQFASENDEMALPQLNGRSHVRDFLDPAPLPEHDYVIVNPPYARTTRISGFRTAESNELYAYFLERVALESDGFIAITPASHLGGSKYASLRALLSELRGGDVLVFDNVPDTCFRGYKYGSTNTSKTNFVRAAITVSAPGDAGWLVSPILRWAARSRSRMFAGARNRLVPLRTGPDGEWAKVMPDTEHVWDTLSASEHQLGDLLSRQPTEHRLHVASTPRYYISATKRELDRGSKHTLYFRDSVDLERAYLLLNSSLPYWWWRCLDGGITLPLRTLMSLPVPKSLEPSRSLSKLLEESETVDVVTKLNAGRQNENVRRPRSLVAKIDADILEGIRYDFAAVYAPDMFAED